jgi:hypothetical protein
MDQELDDVLPDPLFWCKQDVTLPDWIPDLRQAIFSALAKMVFRQI